MAGSNEKGSVQADIGQDVIDEAVRSVERRMDEGEEVVTQVEVEAAEASSEPVSAPPESQPQVEDAAALRQELESVRAQLELSMAKGRETMERLREAHERAKDFQDRALRAAADLENFRKRALKEKEEVQKFGVEKLLKDLLPVMDNMDRALEAAARSPDIDSFQKGVAMTRKSFEDALGKHGVKAFTAKGQPFDPRLHEAVQQVETAEVPAGHVVMELVRGFFLNERLARPALVVVARPPAEAPAPPAEPAASEQSSGGSQ
ncbi:nucleotide exchange factor GrpE [Myxococcaceae bacterium JPH2]|nr:nucleotide exchange factor GrpE [Myxococcaceae bacterium JPH2]